MYNGPATPSSSRTIGQADVEGQSVCLKGKSKEHSTIVYFIEERVALLEARRRFVRNPALLQRSGQCQRSSRKTGRVLRNRWPLLFI